MDGTVEIRSHLVLTDDEIDTLVFRQRGSDAVAAAVNVDELARLCDTVERRDVDICCISFRLRLITRHLLTPVPVKRVFRLEFLIEAHLLQRHRAAKTDSLALDGLRQVRRSILLRIEHLEHNAALPEIFLKRSRIHNRPPIVHTIYISFLSSITDLCHQTSTHFFLSMARAP